MLESSKWSLSYCPSKILYAPLLSSHTCYMPHPSHSSRFGHPNNNRWGGQIIKLLIMYSSPLPFTSSLLGPSIFLSILFSNNLSLRSSLSVSDQVSNSYKYVAPHPIKTFLLYLAPPSEALQATDCELLSALNHIP